MTNKRSACHEYRDKGSSDQAAKKVKKQSERTWSRSYARVKERQDEESPAESVARKAKINARVKERLDEMSPAELVARRAKISAKAKEKREAERDEESPAECDARKAQINAKAKERQDEESPAESVARKAEINAKAKEKLDEESPAECVARRAKINARVKERLDEMPPAELVARNAKINAKAKEKRDSCRIVVDRKPLSHEDYHSKVMRTAAYKSRFDSYEEEEKRLGREVQPECTDPRQFNVSSDRLAARIHATQESKSDKHHCELAFLATPTETTSIKTMYEMTLEPPSALGASDNDIEDRILRVACAARHSANVHGYALVLEQAPESMVRCRIVSDGYANFPNACIFIVKYNRHWHAVAAQSYVVLAATSTAEQLQIINDYVHEYNFKLNGSGIAVTHIVLRDELRDISTAKLAKVQAKGGLVSPSCSLASVFGKYKQQTDGSYQVLKSLQYEHTIELGSQEREVESVLRSSLRADFDGHTPQFSGVLLEKCLSLLDAVRKNVHAENKIELVHSSENMARISATAAMVAGRPLTQTTETAIQMYGFTVYPDVLSIGSVSRYQKARMGMSYKTLSKEYLADRDLIDDPKSLQWVFFDKMSTFAADMAVMATGVSMPEAIALVHNSSVQYTGLQRAISWSDGHAARKAELNAAQPEPLRLGDLLLTDYCSSVDLKDAAHWASEYPDNFPQLRRTLRFEVQRAQKMVELGPPLAPQAAALASVQAAATTASGQVDHAHILLAVEAAALPTVEAAAQATAALKLSSVPVEAAVQAAAALVPPAKTICNGSNYSCPCSGKPRKTYCICKCPDCTARKCGGSMCECGKQRRRCRLHQLKPRTKLVEKRSKPDTEVVEAASLDGSNLPTKKRKAPQANSTTPGKATPIPTWFLERAGANGQRARSAVQADTWQKPPGYCTVTHPNGYSRPVQIPINVLTSKSWEFN